VTGRTGTVLPFIDGRQACASVDPELFFAAFGARGDERLAREQDAKAVCERCPLVRECLAHALTHAEWGVWGGTSEEDRVALQRRHGLPRRVGPPRTLIEIRNAADPTDYEED
jgi:WhiB family transcriptional regulator, redox-sensing transcriptional regulator